MRPAPAVAAPILVADVTTPAVDATDIQAALVAAQVVDAAKSDAPVQTALRPTARPAQPSSIVLASIAPAPVPEVVTRLSSSGGRQWGVNVGRYTSRYKAEKVLLKTALVEMSSLDGSLRKVVKSPRGFDANFLGMTRESADLACRRLQARNIQCFTMGPGT